MTTVLQISDTHIVRPGQLASGRLDTAGCLEALVASVVADPSRFGTIDAVLVTGDLSDDGSAESYALFKSLIAPIDAPLFVIPGNHDLRVPMREVFADQAHLPAKGKLNWHQRLDDIDLIGLDTLIEGVGGGEIDTATLGFLEKALSASGSRPVLLGLHHPPFQSGIAFMDQIGLSGINALADILSRFEGDIRVVCGHIHSTMVATVGGKTALSAPSPGSTFAFNVQPDAPVGFHDQQDGYMLHRWQGGFQSVRIPMQPGPGPFPFG
jgi:3',5'-cyclic AMP phosphodiesterase CpdA